MKEAMQNAVGPVFRMTADVDALIRAIEEDNPSAEIEVIDRGAYVRIQAREFLKVTRATIERHVGRPFPMHEMEIMLSSFAGRIRTTSDEIVWEDGRHV